VELIESGIEADHRRRKEFFAPNERFRAAGDPEEVQWLGDELAHIAFGG